LNQISPLVSNAVGAAARATVVQVTQQAGAAGRTAPVTGWFRAVPNVALGMTTLFPDALAAAVTNAVVATWVVLVPAVAVGAVGIPVNAGDANGAPAPDPAFARTNAVVATCVVFVPAVAVGATGTPVNDGEANGAFASNAPCNPDVSAIASALSGIVTVPVNVGFAADKAPVKVGFAAVKAVVNVGEAVGAAPNNPRIVEKLFGVTNNVRASDDIFVTLARVDAPPLTPAN
jgi:hypothetical protein